MTKFADQLFDDLMQEHGTALDRGPSPATPRRRVRPLLLAAGAGGAAVATAVGLLAAGGGTPAYAVTRNSDGTVAVDVFDQSGIAGANQALHKLGADRVVVVPVRAGCPSISSLPKPVGHGTVSYKIDTKSPARKKGPVIVDVKGIPAGDILVVAYETAHVGKYRLTWMEPKLTRPPAPSCVSVP